MSFASPVPLPGQPAALRCTRCVDTAIEKGTDPQLAPAGAVMVPFTQVMNTPAGSVVASSAILLCLDCRKADFAPSRNGRLLQA